MRKELLPDVKAKVDMAFRKLRKAGFTALQNYSCCQSCAVLPEDSDYVYYHKQDGEVWKNDHMEYLHIRHGRDKVAATKIIEIMSSAGLKVDWNGDIGTTITVRVRD